MAGITFCMDNGRDDLETYSFSLPDNGYGKVQFDSRDEVNAFVKRLIEYKAKAFGTDYRKGM